MKSKRPETQTGGWQRQAPLATAALQSLESPSSQAWNKLWLHAPSMQTETFLPHSHDSCPLVSVGMKPKDWS